jgi:hypothetical protein
MDANDFYAQANGQQQVHAHDLSQQRLSQCCTSQGAADGDGLLDGDRVEERGVDLLFFGQLVFVSGGDCTYERTMISRETRQPVSATASVM